MIKDYKKYLKLSKAANSTFGTPGVGYHPLKYTTQILRVEVINDKLLKFKYQALVNFSSRKILHDLLLKHKSDAISMVEASVEKYQNLFEKMHDEKVKLQINGSTATDSIEYIDYKMYTGKQRGIFRFEIIVNVL